MECQETNRVGPAHVIFSIISYYESSIIDIQTLYCQVFANPHNNKPPLAHCQHLSCFSLGKYSDVLYLKLV